VFLLQPIVENAIRHGISKKLSGGTLIVRALRRDEKIVFEVEDDGPGPGAGFVGVRQGKGVGLTNTDKRLLGMYGQRYHFSVEKLTHGTLCRVEIPFDTMPLDGAGEGGRIDG
jgi:LytS/YehU family sensor histidine kinase